MREWVKDSDGDVWQRDADGADSWYSPGLTSRTYEEIDREFGPLLPCNADGGPVDSVGTTRALVAAAFEDFANRLEAEWRRTPIRSNPFGSAAKDTAAAIRSGELSSSATHP